jgi:hypothetical protein
MKFTDNETIRNVADVAAKIMFGQSVQDEPEMISEELKGKQHKIDKNKNGKIDGEDFKLLRKEEETTEEETIDEVKMADLPSRKVQGRSYGASAPDVQKPYKAPSKKDLQDIESNNKKKKSSFTEMISNYQLVGLKSLSEWSKKDDVEQIDELSNDTLKNYTDKAKAVSKNAKAYGSTNADPDDSDLADKNWNKHEKLEKGIMKAKEKMNKEEVEQIDELSKSTLGSYVNKASRDASTSKAASANWAHTSTKAKNPRVKDAAAKYSDEEEARHNKRMTGIGQAVKKITKEESELDEREMTDAEMNKREDIVKGMKKGMAGFKDRYGDKAKNVMYATATKQAMKD